MAANFIRQCNIRLDELLGLTSKATQSNDPQVKDMLQVASLLTEMDFDSEIAPRADIRSRWLRQTQKSNPSYSLGTFFMFRWKWIFIFVLLILVAAFRQPVFAAVSRALGYVYVSYVGFLPRDSTFLLKQPTFQEHDGQAVTAARGMAVAENVILFLEFSDVARPVDGAWLETASGQKLELVQWEYFPNTANSRGVKMIFPPLPSGITQTTLSLREGWHLPLDWIPASQSNLPDTRVVPYVSATQESASSFDLCVEKHGINLCVLAATGSGENTLVLVKAESRKPDLIPGDMVGLLTWQTENGQVTLQDEQGNIFPMNSEQDGTLTFPPLPADQKVTLTIPALLATVDVPDQNIVVDMGDNPQSDAVIPLDVNIQVLSATVHFSNATFVGDGVNSLRLTLNADDLIQTVDGVTPISFELGKPDRVDDLYGSGILSGSKDIFIELVRPSGKITGKLTIPIVRATVAINGPFEFNFKITNDSSLTPTPAEVDPNIFSPAPTPTSLPLDDYSYKGEMWKSGDLIFTVYNGKKSDLYAFTPDLDSQPRLVATLPSAVAQVYIHPDTQGIDYLAGSHEFRDGFNYIDNIHLYRLRFAEGRPRLLYSFTPNPTDLVGTAVEGSWSYDGRYAIFRYAKSIPGNNGWKFLWMDMACPAGEDCAPHEIVLDRNLELFKAYFAPADYRILFTGSDTSATGEPDLFMLDFDPASTNTHIVNLTSNSSSFADDVGVSPAIWTPDGSIFTLCHDGQMSTLFCYVDPKVGNIISGADYAEHISNYQLSSSGKQVLAVVINHDAPGKGILEIRLFDLNGNAGPAFATNRMFNVVVMSTSEQYLAYVPEYSDQLNMIDLLSEKTVLIYTSDGQWAISWAGWVR